MALDQLVRDRIGSEDWNGGKAPAGGTHTGTAIVTMQGGATFAVAHSKSEALIKIAEGSEPSNPGGWVAFDQPGSGQPIVLNVLNVQFVT